MDFVFGTLATDQLRLLHHSIGRTGIQHAHEITPIDPKPGEAVTLTVRIGQHMPSEHVACYYSTTDSDFICSRGATSYGNVVLFEKVAIEWDTPTMSYSTVWECELPPQEAGTMVYYRISAWSGDKEVFADYPHLKATTERASDAFFRGLDAPDLPPLGSVKGESFVYHVDDFQTPVWARNMVMYHIMVDRFYPGDDREWLKPNDLQGFYGGTLWGVRDKLDYIQDLGIDCIWLSPTFATETHHGYDIIDYEHVEPRYGGDEAMHALVEAAHKRGIRIVLDLVANHMSYHHPYFMEALENTESPYRGWFTFDDSELGYDSFFGVARMPTINLHNPAARAWMLRIGQYWLREFDVDGYRLDHANGPGADFWAYFRAALREVKSDAFCFGEVVEAPNIQRAYVGRLDGLLDFHLESAIRKTYAWNIMTESELREFVQHHNDYFPSDFVLPTFLDNHDMNRFLFVVKGDKEALKRAATAQMKLPNPPIIYYGTEVGLSQDADVSNSGLEESRLPMPWGEDQDADLLEFYKGIIAERQQSR